MLLVVAGLWLWVFIPSWLKRSEGREQERKKVSKLRHEVRAAKRGSKKKQATKQPTLALRNYYLSLQDEIQVNKTEESTEGWTPNALPAQLQKIGSIELSEIAKVVSLEVKREQIKMSSAELDEILRRRRANG